MQPPPFTSEQFFDAIVRYHERFFPLSSVLLAIGAGLTVLALAAPRHSRVVVAGFSALWVWMAVAYHFAFFTAVTPMAWLFGALFLVEAALLAWHGLHTRRLHLASPRDRASLVVGGALAVYALVGYPMLGALLGQRYPWMPTFGLPCPTTILTFALLAWCVRPVPWSLLVVPVAWSILGISAAMSFGVLEDIGLPIAALLTIALLVRPRERQANLGVHAARPPQLGF